jgi:hypothetical protein
MRIARRDLLPGLSPEMAVAQVSDVLVRQPHLPGWSTLAAE